MATTAGKVKVSGSKRYQKAAALVDRAKRYTLDEAMALLKTLPATKFDETVNCCVRLGIDRTNPDAGLRGTVVLPHGLGKAKKVIAFADGAIAEQALQAGAAAAGGEELVAKVLGGWTDFDVAIAHPALMRHVGKLGRVLGPQGKMPSPKAGTVTDNVAEAVRQFSAGKLEFRTDNGANVHVPVGKRSFEPKKLVENVRAVLDALQAIRPASGIDGEYVVAVTVSSAMGPGVHVTV
jgi:large subunit ribosomal protein L1